MFWCREIFPISKKLQFISELRIFSTFIKLILNIEDTDFSKMRIIIKEIQSNINVVMWIKYIDKTIFWSKKYINNRILKIINKLIIRTKIWDNN